MAKTNDDTQKFKIDEFLEEQDKAQFLATIEPVREDAKLVKITPWRPAGGCMCHASMKIPKEAVVSVSPTGDIHLCCGKSLKVVEVEISEAKTIPVSHVIAQMMSKGEEDAAPHHDDRPTFVSRASNPPQTRRAAGTCVCDHFIRRYCVGATQYEDYACYDDTGASCGNTTVATGGFCPQEAPQHVMRPNSMYTHYPQSPAMNLSPMRMSAAASGCFPPCPPGSNCCWCPRWNTFSCESDSCYNHHC
jgi:hypothetical protein